MDEAPIGTETTKRMVTTMMMSECWIRFVVDDDHYLMMMLMLLILFFLWWWWWLPMAFSKGKWVLVARVPHPLVVVHCSPRRHRHHHRRNSCCDEPVYFPHCESGYY